MATHDLSTMPRRIQRGVVIDPDTGCWLWTGRTHEGYGVVSLGRACVYTYVLTYLLVHGDVPGDGDGMCLDHVCRNRSCCNPAHLEEVTHRENILRGDTIPARNAAKTQCPAGHSYDEANTYLIGGRRRQCRICTRERGRRYRARQKELTRDGQ